MTGKATGGTRRVTGDSTGSGEAFSESRQGDIGEVARIITSRLEVDNVYSNFTDELRKLVDFDRANITVIDLDAGLMTIKYLYGLDTRDIEVGSVRPLAGSQAEQVARTGRTLRRTISDRVEFREDRAYLDNGLRSAITVPLHSAGKVVGTLGLRSRQPDAYGPEEQEVLESLASLIAPAVENSHLYQQLEDRTREVELVDEVARIITSTLNIDEVYEQFATQMKKLVHFDRIGINVVNPDRGTLEIKYLYGAVLDGRGQGDAVPLAGTTTERMLQTGKTVIRRNMAASPEFARDSAFASLGLRSAARVPLVNNGRIIGSLAVHSSRVDAYGPREVVALERLARQIAPAVENARLYQQLQGHTHEMALVDQVARILTSTLDIDQVYERFALEMKSLVAFDRLTFDVINQVAGIFVIKYLHGLAQRGRSVGQVVPLEGTPTGQMVARKETVIRRDTLQEAEFPVERAGNRLGLRSAIRLPLVTKGKIIGALTLQSCQVNAYGPREQAILERLASQVAPAVENASLYQELQESAREMALVDQIAQIITSTLEIDEVYHQFAEEMKKLVDFDRMVVNLVDQQAWTYTLKCLFGQIRPTRPVGSTMPLANTQNEQVVRSGKTLIRRDTRSQPLFESDRESGSQGMRSSIMVPLVSKGRVIGTLGLRSRRADAFGWRDQVILERLASQIAPAVENADLYQQRKEAEDAERLRNHQMETLFNIASTLVQPGSFEDKCRQILEALGQSVDSDAVMLRLVNPDQSLALVAATTSRIMKLETAPIMPAGEGVAGVALGLGEPVVANDYAGHPNSRGRTIGGGVRSLVALPVKIGAKVLGVISVASHQENHFTPERVRLLCAVGDGLGMLLENARLSRDLRVSTEETAVVDEVTRIVTTTLNIEEVCEKFIQTMSKLVSWDQASITVVNHATGTYQLRYSGGLDRPGLAAGMWVDLKDSQTGYVVQTGQTLVRGSLFAEPRFAHDQVHWEWGLRSNITAPLIAKGQVIGALILRSQQPGAYGPREQEILERLTRQLAPAVENASLFEEAQAEKERATTALAQLKAVLSSVDAGILLVSNDLGGNELSVLWANHRFGELFGIADVEALMSRGAGRQEIRDYLRQSLVDPGHWFATVDQVDDNPEFAGALGYIEVSHPVYRVLHPFITPVYDDAGECIGRLFVYHDITEQKRAEEQVLQAQRIESVGRLAGGIAHDFNNLLTAIMGYCQLSLWEAPVESDLEAHLQELQKSAERAANLTNQLLAFSRRQVVEAKVISLNDLIIGLDRMLRRLIGENIELVTLPGEELAPVKADPGQLEQVLMNLVINARDAMPDGGKLVVTTSKIALDDQQSSVDEALSPGDHVMLEVSDSGIGMTDAVKAHIFEPFFTTKSVGRGTGLGLATCYGIVRQSGGYIEVDSAPGRGTTFKILLPATPEPVYAVPDDVSLRERSRGTETVLLAEDDPLVRSMVTTILSDQGYRVLAAANGDEALRMARETGQGEIDLLLTDMIMPHMGGLELATKLKETFPATKVIFTSGYNEEPMFQPGYLDPEIEFIQKPYVPAVLGRKVRDVLDQNLSV